MLETLRTAPKIGSAGLPTVNTSIFFLVFFVYAGNILILIKKYLIITFDALSLTVIVTDVYLKLSLTFYHISNVPTSFVVNNVTRFYQRHEVYFVQHFK